MNRALSRSIAWSRRATTALAAASPARTEADLSSLRGGRSLLSSSVLQSLRYWLVFGGAALPAIKLAERCGHISPPGTIVEWLMSVLVIVPVGMSLVVVYRRRHRMDLWEAVARTLLFVLLGAVAAVLLSACEA